jgi:hypothetical protein
VTDLEDTAPTGGVSQPRHLAPDDAGDRPLIDLTRDPTPGKPDHAAPEDDASSEDAASGDGEQ